MTTTISACKNCELKEYLVVAITEDGKCRDCGKSLIPGLSTNPPTEPVSDSYRVSERPYTDKLNAQEVRIRTYNYPGGREALIQRAVNWRGFTREEAEKQYPEEIL